MISTILLLVQGTEFLTREEAVRLFVKNGERVVERAIRLDEADRKKIAEKCGGEVPADHAAIGYVKDGKVAGYAMIVREVTKTLPVTFIVGVGADGRVLDVAVLRHDEHIGVDCAKRRFLKQFEGKAPSDRLRMGANYDVVSGATLSCNAIARGVRRVLAVVQHHFVDRPANAAALAQEEPVRQQRLLMGALCAVTVEGDKAAIEKAFDAIKGVDAAISNWRDDSELAKLHRERSIEAGPELLAFVKASVALAERTDGAFDPTVGPLVRLWGFLGGKHRVPAREEIDAALKRVGWRKIRVEGSTVTLPEGVELDPGAIGKGLAVDRAIEALRKAGVKRALVDFGSTIGAIGEWTVGIRDPFAEGKLVTKVAIRDETLSTSGGYEKYFEHEGKRYAHILDPRTGSPAEGMASASVIAKTGAESDALATALYVSRKVPEGVEALLVPDKGAFSASGRFSKAVK
jgi:thiamine biosynthesis lipoprotein ApbE